MSPQLNFYFPLLLKQNDEINCFTQCVAIKSNAIGIKINLLPTHRLYILHGINKIFATIAWVERNNNTNNYIVYKERLHTKRLYLHKCTACTSKLPNFN
jgi:hypothetical protein